MMPFLKKKPMDQHEYIKFSYLKKRCKIAANTLIKLQQEHQANHCVVVMGQPESGKSILCSSHAKLLSPTRDELHRPDRKTELFEIYLHEKTLFLHIPHDFFLLSNPNLTKRLWVLLANYLRKYYVHFPITHCIVCVDLHDFLTRSNISNATRLTQISHGLKTLAGRLNLNINVSIFFTKTDLIPGFTEFFEHESQEFLEQPWGVLLEDTTKEFLLSSFDRLIKKINERLMLSLHHEAHIERLHLIKAFPLLLETIKQKILETLPDFLTECADNDRLCTTRLYFVSCRQYRELFEMPAADKTSVKPYEATNKHKYFFSKCALEEHCHYQQHRKYIHAENITRLLFIVLCVLVFVGFVAYFAEQFSQQIRRITAAKSVMEVSLAFSQKPVSSLTLNNVTAKLHQIRTTWEALSNDEKTSIIQQYIFTRNHKLETQLQFTYQRILSQQWRPLVNQQLEEFVNGHISSSPEKAYIAFSLYMMLSQPQLHIDAQLIEQHLPQILDVTEIPVPFLLETMKKNMFVVDENSAFIEKTQEIFSKLPANKLAYILFFSTIDPYAFLDISDQWDNQEEYFIFDKKYASIPEIYTKKQFQAVYQKNLPAIAYEAIHGNKILGELNNSQQAIDDLLSGLQEDYIKLYSSIWEEAIQHIQLRPAQSFDELSQQLAIITNVKSPLLTLLNLSQINTHIPKIEQASAFLTTFNNTLTTQSTPDNNALYHCFALLIKLRQEIISLKTQEDTCQLLVNENAATPQNPTEAKQISMLATQLPDPIQTWLHQIIDAYFGLLHQQADSC